MNTTMGLSYVLAKYNELSRGRGFISFHQTLYINSFCHIQGERTRRFPEWDTIKPSGSDRTSDLQYPDKRFNYIFRILFLYIFSDMKNWPGREKREVRKKGKNLP